MNLVGLAALLGAVSFSLLGPISRALAGAEWVVRAPKTAVLLWQSLGLSALVAGIGAGLSLAVYRYHMGFAGGVLRLGAGIGSGRPLQGLGLPDALGLTLAADLLVVLVVVFGTLTVHTLRTRARHRRLLNLLARRSARCPGTDVLQDERAIAYCIPGRQPRIVISAGALQLLSPMQVTAVIEHERGHAHGHHGLVLLPMVGLRKVFGWIPYARLAPTEMAMLLEMSADDFSARRNGPFNLATALVEMAVSGSVPTCALGVTGDPVPLRVSRLLGERRTSPSIALTATLAAVGTLALPVALMVLS